MTNARTTLDYRCGVCGAAPGEPCVWLDDDVVARADRALSGRSFHPDRRRRFVRSVNRGIRRGRAGNSHDSSEAS